MMAVGIEAVVRNKAKAAKKAAAALGVLSSGVKDKALLAMAEALIEHSGEILAANAKDMEAAKEKGTKASYLDRLQLTEARIEGMAEGLWQSASTAPSGPTAWKFAGCGCLWGLSASSMRPVPM